MVAPSTTTSREAERRMRLVDDPARLGKFHGGGPLARVHALPIALATAKLWHFIRCAEFGAFWYQFPCPAAF
jgi:hypothetical protein